MFETSEYGRPVVWLAEWSWYGGASGGACLFESKEEAIKYAIFQVNSNFDWDTFPSQGNYPDEDRDGNEKPALTPIFRVTWDEEGGGYAQVTRIEADPVFSAANDRLQRVDGIYRELQRRGRGLIENGAAK